MRRVLPYVIVIAVGVATLVSATMLYRAKRPVTLTISSDQRVATGLDTGVHARGPADAAVTLEEFGDFQCPPCSTLSGPIKQLEEDFGKNLRVVFHHFPLPNHQHAVVASIAAEAAGLQGRFWDMHDLLYREQSNWSKATDVQALFDSYAGILGLDIERFKKDSQTEEVKARVMADQKRGASLGVQNTPTIFLNNKAVPASDLAPPKLRAAVEAAIKEKTAPSS